MDNNSKPHYRTDIDGLRAIAVLVVVFFHAFSAKFSGGYAGVDIFFVISGYLISLVIFNQIAEKKFSFKYFYIRRINRIFPSLLLVFVFCLVFGWFSLFSGELKELGKHIAGGSAFISNFLLWNEFGYFDIDARLKPFLHLWSLSLEEQFYIIWPFIIYYAVKRRMNMKNVIIGMGIVSLALNFYIADFDVVGAFYLLPTRFWELLVGGFLGYSSFLDKNSGTDFVSKNMQSFLGVILIVSAILIPNFFKLNQVVQALIPVAGAYLIISAGPHAWFNRRVLSMPVLIWIGMISYPLYLWHWPIFSFLNIIYSGSKISTGIWFLAILVSFILSYVTYMTIEKPIKRNKNSSFLSLWFIIGMVLIATVGCVVHLLLPLRSSLGLDEIERNRELLKEVRYKDECVNELSSRTLEYCSLYENDKNPTIALIGDSHANALYPGLAPAMKGIGENLLLAGKGGCVPFFNTESGFVGNEDTCSKDVNHLLEFVIHSPTIKTIIIFNRGPLYINGKGLHESRRASFIRNSLDKSVKGYSEVFENGMRSTLLRFSQSDKKIVFVEDNPELVFDPAACLQPRPFAPSKLLMDPCQGAKDSEYKNRRRSYEKIVDRVLKDFPEMIRFSSENYFCDENNCRAIINGELMYRDNNHLTKYGAEYLANKIVEKVFKGEKEH